MPETEAEATRAVAKLPGLDIEVRHRQSPDGLAEEISINLRATPSFDAFARSIEALSPLAFWAHATRLALLPWAIAARLLMPPELLPPPMPERNPKRISGF